MEIVYLIRSIGIPNKQEKKAVHAKLARKQDFCYELCCAFCGILRLCSWALTYVDQITRLLRWTCKTQLDFNFKILFKLFQLHEDYQKSNTL